jgi:hypothetical protein
MFELLQQIADKRFDGHLTIMKFTTNWRVGFITAENRCLIQKLSEGKTFEEAAIKAIIKELK